MRYLLYVSLCTLLLFSCTRKTYKDKKEITLPTALTATDLRPHFDTELYRCVVDGKFGLKKFHLSGLLYFRNFADTATRVIFQSEMGATFFDFGWNNRDSFQVYTIVDQMNKPALIKTLRKDFEMLLVKNLSENPTGIYHFNNDPLKNYVRFELEKGFVYYITDRDRHCRGIENADEQRKVVVMDLKPGEAPGSMPAAIDIRHLRAGFTIELKKIKKDDATE